MKLFRKGSALLMVLGFLAFISMVLVSLSQLISYDIDQELIWAKEFEARLLAESGLAIAMHPQVERTDPLLREFEDGPNDEGFSAEIINEEAFLNIKKLLDDENEEILQRLFSDWGMQKSETDQLLDRLFDWVDADEETRLNGAEREAYESAGLTPIPPNRSILAVDELRYVMGLERLNELKPDWEDYFTIHGSGRIDVNDADAELIVVVADLGEFDIDKINDYRWGPDRVENTEDDRRFGEIEGSDGVQEFLDYMGLTSFSEELGNLLTAEGNIVRITSTGRIGDFESKIRIVTNSENVTGNFLEYRED
ncbi:MAG: hypothetical protein AAFY98_03085 [Verrucomicrobiota bacterium]